MAAQTGSVAPPPVPEPLTSPRTPRSPTAGMPMWGGDPAVAWRQRLLAGVRSRNARERDQFAGLVASNAALSQQLRGVQAAKADLERQVIILKHEASGSPAVAAAVAGTGKNAALVKSLQDKLLSLQDELSARYKSEAASAQAQVALSRENRELEAKVKEMGLQLERAAADKAMQEAEAARVASSVAVLQGRLEVLQEELTTCRGMLEDKERQVLQLRTDNETLVMRLLEEKEKVAAQLNDLNEEVEQSGIDLTSIVHEERKSGRAHTGRVRPTISVPSGLDGTIEAHDTEVNGVKFTPSGSHLLSASSDGTCKMWDVSTSKLKATLRAGHPLMCVDTFSSMVLGGSNDSVARVWDVESERVRFKLAGHGGKIYDCCFVGDGRRVVTGGTDRQIKVWDLGKRAPCVRTIHCKSIVNSVKVSPEGTFIVSGHQDGGVRLWEASSGRLVADTKSAGVSMGGPITCVALSPGDGGRRLLACSKGNQMSLFDARSLVAADVPAMKHSRFRVSLSWTRATFSPGAFYACAGSSSGELLVWSADSSAVERVLEGHETSIPCVDWSPDGLRVASADKRGVVRLWK